MLAPVSAPTASNVQPHSLEASSREKEGEFNALIEQIGTLALTSPHPEDYFQEMSIMYFENNQPLEALQAVKLAEEWAKNKKTAPLRIYSALFHRAKHFLSSGNDSELKIAERDLFNISCLNEISTTEKLEVYELYDQVVNAKKPSLEFDSLYAQNLKNLFKRKIIYLPCCIENPSKDISDKYIKALNTYNFANNNKCKHAAGLGFKNALPIFDKIIASKESCKFILQTSLYCRAYIHYHFNCHLMALEDIEKALHLEPNDEKSIALKDNLENKLLAMGAKERLKWINLNLQERKSDPGLLLWKAEAHFHLAQIEGAAEYFQLDQIESGTEAAKMLLGIIDESHPHYKIALNMTEDIFTKFNM